MSIDKLQVGDKLRFQDDSSSVVATLGVINADSVETVSVGGDIEIIAPVYGNPYIKFDNPTTAGYTKGSVAVEGTKSAFDALTALVSTGSIKPVSLLVGGDVIPERVFFRCIIIGVSIKEDLKKPDTWVTGQISYIKL